MHTKDRIKAGRMRLGMTHQAFGDAVGVSRGAVQQWERGDTEPTRKHQPRVAALLGISVAELMHGVTGEGTMEVQGSLARVASSVGPAPALKAMRAIPVVGEAKGGPGGYLAELEYPVGHGEGVVDYPTTDPNAYALRVRGDSMHPRYRAGEFIVIEPNIEPQQGDDVVVSLRSGEKLLKELNWQRDGELQLLSVNNHVPPMTVPQSDVKFMHLVAGRVRRTALQKPGQ